MDIDMLKQLVMREFGWTEEFARHYVMERCYNNLPHKVAYYETMKSPWINDSDKPKAFKF